MDPPLALVDPICQLALSEAWTWRNLSCGAAGARLSRARRFGRLRRFNDSLTLRTLCVGDIAGDSHAMPRAPHLRRTQARGSSVPITLDWEGDYRSRRIATTDSVIRVDLDALGSYDQPNMAARKHSVISLFSGALGLDLGLERAGFEIRAAIECNKFAVETIKKNRPRMPLIRKRLEEVPTEVILKTAGLRAGEVTLVTGGPSCQPFSTAGRRGSVDDPRGMMFREFLRVVREARPKFFVMENVRGVMSAAIKHRPLKDRGPGTAPLAPEEELGSAFVEILKELKRTRYYIVFGIVNAADYGVPQSRHRLLFIGSRDGHPISLPKRTYDEAGAGGLPYWRTLADAFQNLHETSPEYHELTPRNKKYLSLVPEGGNWRDLPPQMQKDALRGAYSSWGGRSGFFRRLSMNKPAPSLTTCPDGRATMTCHPHKLRPLTVGEYARIQEFPDGWQFAGGTPQKYIQIGNAVPVGLGQAAGNMLKKAVRRSPSAAFVGKISCADRTLMERYLDRPRTFLNPQRMRKVKGIEAAKEWLGTERRSRLKVLKYIEWDETKASQKRTSKRLPRSTREGKSKAA